MKEALRDRYNDPEKMTYRPLLWCSVDDYVEGGLLVFQETSFC